MLSKKIFSRVGLLIFIYLISYSFYHGITHPVPELGDSWDYHIPISKMILNGEIINPQYVKLAQWYYPGSSDAINSLFILFHLPLTISNIAATIVLFLVCWKLSFIFIKDYYFSLLFACTICTLNIMIRWINAVSVDVWVAVFFVLAVILLERPTKKLTYFWLLGGVLGMLIGSKYLAIFSCFILLLFYGRNIVRFISLKNLIVFFIPFTLLGLSWYIRNAVLLKNPIYPLPLFHLPFKYSFDTKIWEITLLFPKKMFDAFFSEYKLWVFSIPLALFLYARNKYRKLSLITKSNYKVFLLGLTLIAFYFYFPTSQEPWIMVSSLRYVMAGFIFLILGCFILAKKYSQTELLSLISIGCMIMVTSLEYVPKLSLFYVPFVLMLIYIIDKYKMQITKMLNA